MPDFDKAARYLAKQDGPGFMKWLWRHPDTPLAFHSWFDARRLALPAEGDLTNDTVAALVESGAIQPSHAQIVEIQTESRPNGARRLLSYLVRLSGEPDVDSGAKVPIQVTGAIINLTGPAQPDSISLTLPGVPGCGLHFQVLQRTLRDEPADETMADILAGRTTQWLLPWIPLMRGGNESSIIDDWKQAAEREPDTDVRGTLAGLTLVFAGLPRSVSAWKQAFKGWNMQRSQIVDEWRLEVRREDLIRLLTKRFKVVPKDIVDRIEAATDLDKLSGCLDQVLDIQSPEELKL